MHTEAVLEAVVVFVAIIAAVRAVAFHRIRSASRSKRELQDVAKAIALGLALTLAPGMRALAAEPAESIAADAHDDAPYSKSDAAEATARQYPDVLASDARDDANLSPGASSDERGSGTIDQDARASAARSQSPDDAAFDDCSCS
jgi:hypothetical protein